ncbi:MAG: GH3 auxin-responsive promoter family protein [Fuerstiella sp.]
MLQLVRAADLSLISVWSPTFLTALLQPLEKWSERICSDLRTGQVSLPGRAEPIPTELLPNRSADRRRSDELGGVIRANPSTPEMLHQLWPQLALISCWTGAAAADYLPRIHDLLPGIEIQPKGLLATEGCVSFPLVDRPGAALAVRSHFFEFQEAGSRLGSESQPHVHMAHELDIGGIYNVILSTGGGLYRYQLRDSVEVVAFENQCPLLRFLGRSNNSCDLVGEKLCEPHVRKVICSAFSVHGVQPKFAMVVPVNNDVPRYRLYVEISDPIDTAQLAVLVQTGLEQNPYYRHAIQVRQLASLEVRIISSGESGWAMYERECMARGQKPGDVKPTAIDPRTGWPEIFPASGGTAADDVTGKL